MRKAKKRAPRPQTNMRVNALRNRIQGALKQAVGRAWKRLVTFKIVADIKLAEFKFHTDSRSLIGRANAALADVARAFGGKYCPHSFSMKLA